MRLLEGNQVDAGEAELPVAHDHRVGGGLRRPLDGRNNIGLSGEVARQNGKAKRPETEHVHGAGQRNIAGRLETGALAGAVETVGDDDVVLGNLRQLDAAEQAVELEAGEIGKDLRNIEILQRGRNNSFGKLIGRQADAKRLEVFAR